MTIKLEIAQKTVGRWIADLDSAIDENVEAEWMKAAHRRLREIESGSVTPFPADEVFERVRRQLAG